jgi:predicted nucleic acid-binding protein
MIVLDTNVVSELMKPSVDPRVRAWLAGCSSDHLATTSITVAEIGAGIEVLTAGARRRGLQQQWRQLLAQGFGDRIHPFDKDAATVYGELFARRRQMGQATHPLDLQIAAIAHTRGFVVATRNTRHFEECGVDLINPWSTSPA